MSDEVLEAPVIAEATNFSEETVLTTPKKKEDPEPKEEEKKEEEPAPQGIPLEGDGPTTSEVPYFHRFR